MRALRAIAAILVCSLAGLAATAGTIAYGLHHDWDELLHDIASGDGDMLGWGLVAVAVLLAGGAGRPLGAEWRWRWGAIACLSVACFAISLSAYATMLRGGVHHFPLTAMIAIGAVLLLGGLGLLIAGAPAAARPPST